MSTHTWPRRVLMVRPNGYRVSYAINPHMLDSKGQLHSVDTERAMAQWENLAQTFAKLGLEVEVIEGHADFPDMVFCANQTLPVLDENQNMQFVLSCMHSPQRKGEVRFFREWAKARKIKCLPITECAFEGAGDAIWNYETREIYAGHGFRTQAKAYDVLAELFPLKTHRLELVDPHFYHLDTCFAVLNKNTAAYVPSAFSASSRSLLTRQFSNLIEIDLEEAKKNFAGNCVSVDGKHVVLQKGATKFVEKLKSHGFNPIEVETDEFIKAGGSVFCMKQMLF